MSIQSTRSVDAPNFLKGVGLLHSKSENKNFHSSVQKLSQLSEVLASSTCYNIAALAQLEGVGECVTQSTSVRLGVLRVLLTWVLLNGGVQAYICICDIQLTLVVQTADCVRFVLRLLCGQPALFFLWTCKHFWRLPANPHSRRKEVLVIRILSLAAIKQ